MLKACRSMYRSMKPFPVGRNLTKVHDYADFPAAAKEYIHFIEEQCGVPVRMISVGPERNAVVKGLNMEDYSSYQSPFSWRYGSVEMRRIWSEENKRLLWRRLWVAMAETQVDFGLVSTEQVQDLKDHASEIDIPGAPLLKRSCITT